MTGMLGHGRRRVARLAIAAAAANTVIGLLVVPASGAAAATPQVTTVSTAYVDPLQLAVRGGRILVTDRGRLSELSRVGVLATGPRFGDLTGVAYDADGSGYAYTSSTPDHADTRLTIVAADGTRVTASLSGFERSTNPDRRISYGVDRPSACVRKAFKALDGGPASYTGRVDSHPVAVANAGAVWFVADAAANAVLRVDAVGEVRLVNVLPRQAFRFSPRLAQGLGLPSCVDGVTYRAEAVPTDVELGPDGNLYVTTRPGLYDLGQGGSLYRMNPRNGREVRIADGFAGAGDLAVTSTGAVFVAEALTGHIEAVRSSGRHSTYLTLPGLAGLEADDGHLYASVSAPVSEGVRTGPGRVVRIG